MNDSKLERILTASLLFNLLALGIAGYTVHSRGGWAYIRDRFGKPRGLNTTLTPDEIAYLTRETLFQRLPARSTPVVFFGDSQTANCEWNELFAGAVNRGIGGDTSAGLLKRVSDAVGMQPRAVFLLIGANDFARGVPPQETAANIRSAVADIRAASPKTTIFVEGLLPTWFARRNLFAARVNKLLEPLADGEKIFYLDFYNSFLEGDFLDSKLSYDGLHLNGAGFMLWKQLLDPDVAPFLQGGDGAGVRTSHTHHL
jgi:lysophospholipase L1-like esterase